jgi:alpha-ribazole phosphatase
MEIILLRHGKTEGNLSRRYAGRTDEPLCGEGRRHAYETGVAPGVASVIVSPMKRALETARIKFPNAVFTVCEDLREMDFGDFEGRTADEMEADADYRSWVGGNCRGRCPNGDSLDEFNMRAQEAFDRLVRDAVKRGEKRLIIVAHGGTIMSILDRYAVPAMQYYTFYVDNCCGYRAWLDDGSWETVPCLTDYEKFEILAESLQ